MPLETAAAGVDIADPRLAVLAAERGWDAESVQASITAVLAQFRGITQGSVLTLLEQADDEGTRWNGLGTVMRGIASTMRFTVTDAEIRDARAAAESFFALQTGNGAAPFRGVQGVFERVIAEWVKDRTAKPEPRPVLLKPGREPPRWARGDVEARLTAAAASLRPPVILNGSLGDAVDSALDIYRTQVDAGGADPEKARAAAVDLTLQRFAEAVPH